MKILMLEAGGVGCDLVAMAHTRMAVYSATLS